MGEREFAPTPEKSTFEQIKGCIATLEEIMKSLAQKDQIFNEQQLSSGVQELERLLGVYNQEPGYDEQFDRAAKDSFFRAQTFLTELQEAKAD
jgi:hypothetical protein